MSGTRWYQERRRDGYYKQAKKEGYRARSAYKLKQMQERFHLLKPGQAVADLGCAPGGWSQVLVELVAPDGVVIGVDLQKTRPIEGATFLQGDFTKEPTHEALSQMLAAAGRTEVDAVVSDMAPDMSGNYGIDQVRSVHLCTMALHFADRHLKDGGVFLCKVFEGADFQDFRDEVRKRYKRVQQFHPPASRKQSSEVYLYAYGFKGAPEDDDIAEPAPAPPRRERLTPRRRSRAQAIEDADSEE